MKRRKTLRYLIAAMSVCAFAITQPLRAGIEEGDNSASPSNASADLTSSGGDKEMKEASKEMKEQKEVSKEEAFRPKEGLYAGLYGGAGYMDTNNYNSNFSSGLFGNGQLGGNWQWVGGVKVGYQWKGWELGDNLSGKGWYLMPAAEFDGFYIGNSQSGSGFTGVATGPMTIAAASTNTGMQLNMGIMTINGLIKLVTPWKFVPYIGMGVGGYYLSASNISQSVAGHGIVNGASTTDGGFVFTPIAGSEYYLTKELSVFVEFKFLYMNNPILNYGTAIGNESMHFGQMLNYIGVLGAKYVFW
ncbi:hypothetical protein [Candidatus Methylacidiphilum infernorum]|uniref:Opacity protein or related surface antigen n=1 Tax=Methylacidiphilum infernorum (isolate V4) TaxID=481448 RepID=B3DYQ5_METI4|nr:hypothetical protein [Candidatus Methylacidiphilum infernorum]ACD82427.1 Opacity protein or related surface antigen [Methylacidiphilum infernorum V4]